jgi:hypothetical protein
MNIPQAQKLFWTHPMKLLGDVDHLEPRFGPFGAVLVSVHDLRQIDHRLRNHFGRTQCWSKVMRLMWKLDSVRLETVLALTQDRCKVCAKHTTGSEIILDTPNGTPR